MHQLKTFWRLVRPFWMQSTGRTGARLLLLAVIGLSLSTVWFSVRLNTRNGAFFNAIQAMDGGTIYPLLLNSSRSSRPSCSSSSMRTGCARSS